MLKQYYLTKICHNTLLDVDTTQAEHYNTVVLYKPVQDISANKFMCSNSIASQAASDTTPGISTYQAARTMSSSILGTQD